jgi:hypothetical protein
LGAKNTDSILSTQGTVLNSIETWVEQMTERNTPEPTPTSDDSDVAEFYKSSGNVLSEDELEPMTSVTHTSAISSKNSSRDGTGGRARMKAEILYLSMSTKLPNEKSRADSV